MRKRGVVTVAAVVLAVSVAGLWIARNDEDGEVLVAGARWPAALAALDDGGLLYGERLTGRIREVDGAGNLRRDAVATVEVSTEGQRGLVGLAVDDGGRVYAAWTRPDFRLVVGRVAPGGTRLVWLGPESTDVATGGHIAVAPDGRLLVGIGDLLEPELVSDPSAPNGKLLALDPDGPVDQQPDVVSAGWNNPFAFTVNSRGELWVADNSPGERPERIARGDQSDPAITELEGTAAPSGLTFDASGRLLMCGYVSRTLQPFQIRSDGTVARDGEPLVTDCALAVTVLSDDRVVYSNEQEIRLLRLNG